ncbi:MAG: P-loop NTPase [Bdellovibrio sp.]
MERDLHKEYLKALEEKSNTSNKNFQTKIWAVASGKGGVGKTFVSSSLGITLSKLGHTVVIVDMDFCGANIHTSLGLPPAALNLRHFFEGSKKLQELINPTSFPNLSYIQGFWDSWTLTDQSLNQVEKILSELKKLKADYVIVDMGAGGTEAQLDLFKYADEKFLITTPEPTSVENTYRFIEAFVCHSLKSNSTPDAYKNMISTLRDHRQTTANKPFSFRSYLKETTGIEYDFFESITSQPIRLVMNSARSESNCELGHSIKSVCNKYYDLSIDYAGSIDFDNAVWQSIRCREHVLAAQPFTPLAGQFLTLCKLLIDPRELRAVV